MMAQERMRSTATPRGVLLMALLAVVGVASCQGARHGADTTAHACGSAETSTAPPVSAPVLGWLSKARALHHAADLAEDRGTLDQAIAWLDELVNGVRPAVQAPEIDDVLADTYARLAELRSRRNAFDQALADVTHGLQFAREPNYFRGHLFEVSGLVHQRLTEKLLHESKHDEAAHARDEAIRLSLEAVRIQDAVIRRSLGDGGAVLERDL